MDRCSKIADVTVTHTNTSQNCTHSWFFSSSVLVPTKNAKSLTPLVKTDTHETKYCTLAAHARRLCVDPRRARMARLLFRAHLASLSAAPHPRAVA